MISENQPARCYLPTLLELKTQHLPSSLLIEFSILVWPTHLLCFFPFVTIIGHHFFFNSPQQKRFKELKSFKFQLQKSGFQIIEIGQEKINDSTFSDIYQYHIRYFISCHLWISHEISIEKVWILYVMHTLDAYTNVLVKNLNF